MDEVSGALDRDRPDAVLVFVPTAFIFISGMFFKQFAITIAASTVISCFVSLTLSPALCAVLLKPHAVGSGHGKPRGLARIPAFAFGLFNASFDWLSSSFGKLTGWFRPCDRRHAVDLSRADRPDRLPDVADEHYGCPDQDIGYQAIIVMLPPGSNTLNAPTRSSVR